jgi:hypothetical protein
MIVDAREGLAARQMQRSTRARTAGGFEAVGGVLPIHGDHPNRVRGRLDTGAGTLRMSGSRRALSRAKKALDAFEAPVPDDLRELWEGVTGPAWP